MKRCWRPRLLACAAWLACAWGAGPGQAVLRAAPPAQPAPLEGWSAAVLEARSLLRAHDARAALERLRVAGAARGQVAEDAWLWVQVAPAFEGRPAVLATLAGWPSSPLRAALQGLLEPSAARARDGLRIRMRREASPWLPVPKSSG